MNLKYFIDKPKEAIAIAAIGGDRQLATEVQLRLSEAGILEPPADGEFGPISQWALNEFLRKTGISNRGALNKDVASALLDPNVKAMFPVNSNPTLASRIVAAMQSKNLWITRHPDCVNIVYVEGLDPDGAKNVDAPDAFNDLRIVIRVNKVGNPEIVGSWPATTEPGIFYTKVKKLDARGAARIAFGQYKSWAVGEHPRGKPDAHEALVQVKDVVVFRDLNEDFEREKDERYTGLFGINQHSGYDMPADKIGNASAGCLVGRTKVGHREFMRLVKDDPRYLASRGFRFMTTILSADALP